MPICSLLRRYHVIKCGLGVNQEADLTSARDFNITTAHSQSISIDVLTDSQRFETSSPSVLFLKIENLIHDDSFTLVFAVPDIGFCVNDTLCGGVSHPKV